MRRIRGTLLGTVLGALAALTVSGGWPGATLATTPPVLHRHPRLDGIPAAPPAVMAGLVGEYGAEGSLLVVYERGGALHADGRGLQAAPLTRRTNDIWNSAGADLVFERDREGGGAAVTFRGQRIVRVDLGAEAEARIRAGVRADPVRLRASALAATPPSEPPPKRRSDLVALASLDPTIRLDIRYATANNFMGVVLYERPGAFLQRPAAEAVARASRSLKGHGYGLMVHDAYRPWFVTRMFWDATPAEFHVFVANPANGSRHNRGGAVDLTLYDLSTGRAVEMPGRYDEFSHRSFPDYIGGTSRQRALRDLLRREMERQGFTVYPQEWWHFDYPAWRDYGIGNTTFTELVRTGG